MLIVGGRGDSVGIIIRAMLIVGGRRDSAGLIIRAMLVETGERGPCWDDNKIIRAICLTEYIKSCDLAERGRRDCSHPPASSV